MDKMKCGSVEVDAVGL